MSALQSRRSALIASCVLVAVIAAGAVLRFHAIGRKSLWLDEAATMNVVDCRYTEMLSSVIAHDAHPPVYYAMLHLWMQSSHSAVRARAFSAAVSVATLVVFYLLARVLLPRGGALLATGLLAASGFQVYFAQEARHYAMAAFFVTLSWYFFVQLVAGRWLENWRWWLGLALANTAALYTFYYAAFAILPQFVVLLALWRGIGRRLVPGWLTWQVLPAALFALYVPVILDQFGRLRGMAPPAQYTVASVAGLTDTAAQFACGFLGKLMGGSGAVAQAGAAALGLLAVVAGFLSLRGSRLASVVALSWLLGPIVLLALVPFRGHTYEPKHLIFAAPALALLPALAWGSSRGILKGAAIGLAALLLAANALGLARYYDPSVEKEDWRAAVGQLIEGVQPGDIVVFNPFYVRHPFHFYYRDHYRQCPIKPLEAPAVGKAFRAGELELGRRVWVLEGASNVEVPNPEVLRALGGHKVILPPQRREGLVGTVSVSLYDTFAPSAKGTGPAP